MLSPAVTSGQGPLAATTLPLPQPRSSKEDVTTPSLESEILRAYEADDFDTLQELFVSDLRAFVGALRAIEGRKPEEGDNTDYKKIANEIVGGIGHDDLKDRNLEQLKVKDLERVVYVGFAKNKLFDSQLETDLARAQMEAMWNLNAKNVFTAPFNIFRTVIAVATMATNFFASVFYAVGSISCFADVEVKYLRSETAKDYLSRMNHDAINALYGLVQAIPLFGTFVTNMLSNRRYAYENEMDGSQKTQRESWTDFQVRRDAEEDNKKTVNLKLVEQQEEMGDDASVRSERSAEA